MQGIERQEEFIIMRNFFKSSDDYQHRVHNKNLLYVHLIFVVKYRKALIQGSIDTDIKQFVFDCCKSHQWYIRKMESDKDHIHILLQYNPTDSITQIVTVLKSYTTYHIWKRHAAFLKTQFWKEHTFWSDGYFAASIGNASKETIERYIEQQG